MSRSLEEAVVFARQHIPIKKQLTRPEYWDDWIICEVNIPAHLNFGHGAGRFTVHDESAWTPHTGSVLPWRKPIGTPVARVNIEGVLTLLEPGTVIGPQ